MNHIEALAKDLVPKKYVEEVLNYINITYGKSSGIHSKREIIIVDISPYKDDGWIFFYNTKKSVDNPEKWIYGLVGNYPIFVFKDSGKMYSIYPDIDEEEIIRRHRKDYPSHSPINDMEEPLPQPHVA
jgi:hypothetical protein